MRLLPGNIFYIDRSPWRDTFGTSEEVFQTILEIAKVHATHRRSIELISIPEVTLILMNNFWFRYRIVQRIEHTF